MLFYLNVLKSSEHYIGDGLAVISGYLGHGLSIISGDVGDGLPIIFGVLCKAPIPCHLRRL